mgnify:CR=1 FL=1
MALLFFVGFSILAIDRSFYPYPFFKAHFEFKDYIFISKTVRWSSSLVLTVLPLFLIYKIAEKDHPKIYYGLSPEKFDARPYFILLGLAALIVGIGSFLLQIRFIHNISCTEHSRTGWKCLENPPI